MDVFTKFTTHLLDCDTFFYINYMEGLDMMVTLKQQKEKM